MDGHKTYKVEATPVDSSRSQYKYIYYWVAQDVPVILFAEMYDAQGQKVRVLHATDLKKEGGIWGARHTEMRTVQDGTRTVLTIDSVKFNTKPDEKLFTPEGLAGALGAGKWTWQSKSSNRAVLDLCSMINWLGSASPQAGASGEQVAVLWVSQRLIAAQMRASGMW